MTAHDLLCLPLTHTGAMLAASRASHRRLRIPLLHHTKALPLPPPSVPEPRLKIISPYPILTSKKTEVQRAQQRFRMWEKVKDRPREAENLELRIVLSH